MRTRERFETSFSVTSYEIDLTGTLSLFSLFNRFQDLAGEHASYLDVGYDQLRQSNLAWILSRIKVEVSSLPRWGETVTLATWPKGIDRLFALRDFSLRDQTGDKLALATSAWLLVDITKNRPQRLENLNVDLHFPGAPSAIDESLEKIQLTEAMGSVYERPVWLSDIDSNGHVNNAQYAKWIVDCFSEEHVRTHRISSLQINYLEQSLMGDTIGLLKAPLDGRQNEFHVSGINRLKGSHVFQSRIVWD
ncbi:MAG TPA: acyl-ACP thioesterase domain-containing protein [Bacteroidota bacterium]|nr:acyl-ACP thioesterase domain-containing protein [Bacteroidota bacterium]